MNTFASVDNNVRRKLDEMRKTWSQPVPGSQSTYPVFQKTVTSKIDEAMDNWARKQFQNRTAKIPPRGPVAQIQVQSYRSTPTPPQVQPAILQEYPAYQQYSNGNGANHVAKNTQVYGSMLNHTAQQIPSHYSQPPVPVPTPQTYLSPRQPVLPQNLQYGQASYPSPFPVTVDLDALKRDIDDLVVDAKIGSYSNPMDRASQQKLASLQSLKEIVDSGTLSARDLADVRKSMSEQLAARSTRRPTPPPVHTPQPPLSYPYQQSQVSGPPPSSGGPSFLSSTSLADLLRATAPQPQPTPPPIQATPFTPFLAGQHNNQVHVAPPPAENPLIAQLRASGLLPAAPSLSSLETPSATPLNAIRFAANEATTSASVKFSSSSFKMPRPDLLKRFFNARPNRCTMCGRCFTSDEAGRDQKARHLDWHFKTKTRMVEADRKGVQRCWYDTEREWIKHREYEDDEGPPEENGNGSSLSPSGAGTSKDKDLFIRVPNDAKMRNEPCPICQEKFESLWSEELQDFIWRDALKVGNRIYHASCFQEATKDRENVSTPVVGANNRAKTTTPDSVLGKRKAEGIGAEGKATKIKMEQLG